jgi:hypothetical protein
MFHGYNSVESLMGSSSAKGQVSSSCVPPSVTDAMCSKLQFMRIGNLLEISMLICYQLAAYKIWLFVLLVDYFANTTVGAMGCSA